MKIIILALMTVVVAFAVHAQPTSDQIARSLGEMEWHASVCRLPTAPLEAALDRYLQRVQAGPLEAEHLRQEMLAGRTEYEQVFGSHINCQDAAAGVADIIEKTDRYGLR